MLYIMHLFIYFILSFFFWEGGGGGNIQGALWSMCKWRIIAKTILMHFFGGEGRVKRGGFMHEQCESGE